MSGVQRLGACEVRALRGDGVLLEEMRQQRAELGARVSAVTKELTSVIDILGFARQFPKPPR